MDDRSDLRVRQKHDDNFNAVIKGETVLAKRNLSELKNSKPFYLFDLILYLIVAAFTVAAFLFVFANKSKNVSQGFYVLSDNDVAAEFVYSDGEFKIKDGYSSHFSVEEDAIRFYPNIDNFDDYNVIFIDKDKKTVKIADATCVGKDCTFQEVSKDGGFIFCAPHKLKIIPMGLKDPVSG